MRSDIDPPVNQHFVGKQKVWLRVFTCLIKREQPLIISSYRQLNPFSKRDS